MANWYVDNAASGANDGTSWTNAWQSFSVVGGGTTWPSIQPGDVIYISGGSSSKTYNEIFIVRKSGTASTPIHIRSGGHPQCPSPSGHNGQVVINGGGTRAYGFTLTGKNWITIDGYNTNVSGHTHSYLDGTIYPGIKIQLVTTCAVYRPDGPVGIKARHLEIYKSAGAAGGSRGTICLTYAGQNNEISYNWIHNCRVTDGGPNNATGISTAGYTAGESYGFGWILIHHNHVYLCGTDGIELRRNADVYKNVVQGSGTPGTHGDGIVPQGPYCRVWDNCVTDHTQNINIGLLQVHGHHVYVWNNLCLRTALSDTFDPPLKNKGIFIGVNVATAGQQYIDELHVFNNTCVDCWYQGIHISAYHAADVITNSRICNNILFNCGRTAEASFVIEKANIIGSGTVLNYNCTWGSLASRKQYRWGSVGYPPRLIYADSDAFYAATGHEANGVPSDPDLVAYTEYDPDASDYHLKSSSPCRNAGTSGGGDFAYRTHDFWGTTVPQESGWDIGADEYGDGSPPVNVTVQPQALELDWTVWPPTVSGDISQTIQPQALGLNYVCHGIASVGETGGVNTQNKRRSAFNCKIWNVPPVPDGVIDAGDRANLSGVYCGEGLPRGLRDCFWSDGMPEMPSANHVPGWEDGRSVLRTVPTPTAIQMSVLTLTWTVWPPTVNEEPPPITPPEGAVPLHSVAAHLVERHLSNFAAEARLENLANQIEVKYAHSWAADRFEASDDGFLQADLRSQSYYGVRKKVMELKWVRKKSVALEIQGEAVRWFRSPRLTIACEDDSFRFAHLERGDIVAVSHSALRDAEARLLVNQLFRVMEIEFDMRAGMLRLRLVDMHSYLSEAYKADGTFKADGSILAGGNRHMTVWS